MDERIWIVPLFVILGINLFVFVSHVTLYSINPDYGLGGYDSDNPNVPTSLGEVTYDPETGEFIGPSEYSYTASEDESSFIGVTSSLLSDLFTNVEELRDTVIGLKGTIKLLLFGLPILLGMIGVPLFIVYVIGSIFGLLYIFAVGYIIIKAIGAIRGSGT